MSMKNFEKITASPEALARFLEGLDAVGAPWETEFHRTFCEKCEAETRSPYCDAENCPHDEMRDNPLWWLGLDVEAEEPNVCKMLGIGVGVKFRIGNDRTIFWVNGDGSFGTEPACVLGSTYLFLRALNGQENITRLEKEEQKQTSGKVMVSAGQDGSFYELVGNNWQQKIQMATTMFQTWQFVSDKLLDAMICSEKNRVIIEFEPGKDRVSIITQLPEPTGNAGIISQTEDAAT